MTLSQRIFQLLAAPLAVVLMAALPLIASASASASAKSDKKYTPQISNFSIAAQPPIAPGSDIDFTVEGTPRGQASVRISGVNKNINLREVGNGVYQGSYTLSRRDQPGTQPTARASLRLRGMTTAVMQALTPPVASAPPTGVPVIERFGVM